MLLASFPASSADSDAAAAGYLIALDGIEAERIEKAVGNFLRGKVDGWSGKFAPSAAELAKEARSQLTDVERDEMQARWDARQRELRTPALPSTGPAYHTPASRESVAKMTSEYLARHAAAKAFDEASRPKGPDPFAPDYIPSHISPDDPRLASIPDIGAPKNWKKAQPQQPAE